MLVVDVVVDGGAVVELDVGVEVAVATEVDVVGATEVDVLEDVVLEDVVLDEVVVEVELLGVDVLVVDASGGVCARATPADARGARNENTTATERRNDVPVLDLERRTAPVPREFVPSWRSRRILFSPVEHRASSPSAVTVATGPEETLKKSPQAAEVLLKIQAEPTAVQTPGALNTPPHRAPRPLAGSLAGVGVRGGTAPGPSCR